MDTRKVGRLLSRDATSAYSQRQRWPRLSLSAVRQSRRRILRPPGLRQGESAG